MRPWMLEARAPCAPPCPASPLAPRLARRPHARAHSRRVGPATKRATAQTGGRVPPDSQHAPAHSGLRNCAAPRARRLKRLINKLLPLASDSSCCVLLALAPACAAHAHCWCFRVGEEEGWKDLSSRVHLHATSAQFPGAASEGCAQFWFIAAAAPAASTAALQ